MNKLTILFFSILFVSMGCSSKNPKPHFEEVDFDYLTDHYDFKKDDDIDTLVKTKDYEFYYVWKAIMWEGDHYYFLKTKNALYSLQPEDEIANGFKEINVLNDSTLVFYTQLYNQAFGDFWAIRNGDSLDIRLDPGMISNTSEYDLTYDKGCLKFIRNDIKVDFDSIKIKKLRNKLYKLEGDSLKEICEFKDMKTDIVKLPQGVYYFSYPGRQISDTLSLKQE